MQTILPSTVVSLTCLIASCLPVVFANGQLVNDTGCDCYLTNGSNNAYYAEHRFYDFRSLSQYQGVPSMITNQNDTASAQNTSDFFASEDWNSVWTFVNWNNSDQVAAGSVPVFMINSPNNIYIEQNRDQDNTSATYMTMRTARLPDFQSAAEINSISTTYQYISIRMLARTIGSPGAVTAMFTYLNAADPAKVQEADLEIRTMDPRNMIQYTNQPSQTNAGEEKSQATRNATMPFDLSWTHWAVHRLDWTPKQDTWYVDGQPIATISYQTPRDPTTIIFNSWSDGGSWSGNMTTYDEAYLHLQWIEMVFNNTDKVSAWTNSPAAPPTSSKKGLAKRASRCKTVCSIDNTTTTGVATELWSAAPGRFELPAGMLPFILPVLTAAALVFSPGLF